MTIHQKSIATITAVLMVFCMFILMPQVSGASTFTNLGFVDGYTYSSGAYGVSSDGSIVVGLSRYSSRNYVSFKWTEEGGMENLGAIKTKSNAVAVSDDGSRVVGWTYTQYGTTAYLWTESTGMVSLGDFFLGDYYSNASDISADGSVVVGTGSSENGNEAFIWTEETGMVGLGDLEGGDFLSESAAVSADGSIIAGNGRTENGYEAFIWTEETGMVGLGILGEGSSYWSYATDISSDGSTITGYAYGEDALMHSFIWTEETGMVDLGTMGGNTYAGGISGDGSVVVGSVGGSAAFLWTEEMGMVDLYEFLVALGVEGLDGWALTYALSVSDDGLTIVGFGTNPDGTTEAWRVSLDEGTFSAVPVPGAIWLLGSGMIALAGFRRRSGKQ